MNEAEALELSAAQREAGWAASNRGDYGAAREAFTAAVGLLQSIPSPMSTVAKRALANALRARGTIHDDQHNFAAASRDASACATLLAEPDLAAAPGIQRLQVMCRTLQGNLCSHGGTPEYNPEAALEHYMASLAIVEADQRSEIELAPSEHGLVRAKKLPMGIALVNVACAEDDLGRVEEAKAHLTQAIQHSNTEGNPRCAGNAHSAFGKILSHEGRWLEAAQHYRDALRLFREAGQVHLEAQELAILHRVQQTAAELQDQPDVAVELADALRRVGRVPDGTCGICYDELELGPGVFVLEICLHAYHRECVERFWETKGHGPARQWTALCPMCHGQRVM